MKHGEKRSVTFHHAHQKGTTPEFELYLYSSALDTPPLRDDNPIARKSFYLFRFV